MCGKEDVRESCGSGPRDRRGWRGRSALGSRGRTRAGARGPGPRGPLAALPFTGVRDRRAPVCSRGSERRMRVRVAHSRISPRLLRGSDLAPPIAPPSITLVQRLPQVGATRARTPASAFCRGARSRWPQPQARPAGASPEARERPGVRDPDPQEGFYPLAVTEAQRSRTPVRRGRPGGRLQPIPEPRAGPRGPCLMSGGGSGCALHQYSSKCTRASAWRLKSTGKPRSWSTSSMPRGRGKTVLPCDVLGRPIIAGLPHR